MFTPSEDELHRHGARSTLLLQHELVFSIVSYATGRIKHMKSGRPISVLQLTSQQRAELERRVHAGTTSQRDCLRARIILLRADGMRQEDVGREVGLSTTSVNKWSQRFARHGLEGLRDQSGRGRKSSILLEKVARIIHKGS